MPQKTIYLPESALENWEKAKTELGEKSMGTIVMDCIAKHLAEAEAIKKVNAAGLNQLVVDVKCDGEVKKQSFNGVWLVENIYLDPYEGQSLPIGTAYSVARTAKNALAVYQWEDGAGQLYIFDTFEDLRHAANGGFRIGVPEKVVSAVAAKLAIEHIEHLDI